MVVVLGLELLSLENKIKKNYHCTTQVVINWPDTDDIATRHSRNGQLESPICK
jgi:hypothetical protein